MWQSFIHSLLWFFLLISMHFIHLFSILLPVCFNKFSVCQCVSLAQHSVCLGLGLSIPASTVQSTTTYLLACNVFGRTSTAYITRWVKPVAHREIKLKQNTETVSASLAYFQHANNDNTYAPRLVATSSFHGLRLFDVAHGHSQSLVQAAGTIYRRRWSRHHLPLHCSARNWKLLCSIWLTRERIRRNFVYNFVMCVSRSTISAVSAWLYLPFVLIVFSVFYLMLLWLINDWLIDWSLREHK